MKVTNIKKLDFYEAAKLTLLNNPVLREYFKEEENITLENFDALKVTEQYEITQTGISIGYIKKIGKLMSGEDAFSVTTEKERAQIGPRLFIGDKKTYAVNPPIENIFINALRPEDSPELERWEKLEE
jgi:hypothetical protein